MLLTISVTVIAAFIVILTLFLVPVLLRVRRSSIELERLLSAVRTEVLPLSRDIASFLQEANGIMESVRGRVDKLEEGIENVRDIAIRLRGLEKGVRDSVEGPVYRSISLANAVWLGVETFSRIFRRRA